MADEEEVDQLSFRRELMSNWGEQLWNRDHVEGHRKSLSELEGHHARKRGIYNFSEGFSQE